jgi:hypothetical protein
VLRTVAARKSRRLYLPMLVAFMSVVVATAFAIDGSPANASGFDPGNVVVYRVGTGSSELKSSATPVFLDEYEPDGKLLESVALPTTASGVNKPLLGSGSAGSEGLLTLSANDEYLMATGYDTSVGASKVSETKSSSVPRTIGEINAGGEVNTSTALTDFANENNPRSATSTDGTHIWVGGAEGGVRYTTLGSSTSTGLFETDKNVREVSIFGGQLYTSADPTKKGSLTIATVGSGLPTTSGQTIANLPFASAPKEPYAYSFLTLGLGSTPDTLYVADNEAGAVVKYGLNSEKWVQEGSVAIANVAGLTANDSGGKVSIFATSSGAGGIEGRLYEITDESGLGGTLSGVAHEIAKAPANEAFRGVAFAPGTTIGSGGAPPPPAPTITAAESDLPATLQDPTNPTLAVTVGDSEYEASELTVKASSSNTSVAPEEGLSVSGSGATRTLTVTPAAVGYSTITLTVETPNHATATATIAYGVSAYQGDPSDRYYAGAGNGSTAIDVGDGYMIVGDDESNVLRLYHERVSGEPVKTFDFTSVLPYGTTEMDIESSARAGNTLYWMGSLSNSKKGKLEPGRDVLFAATITGSGANTQLTYLGSYTHLRQDVVEWDEANGNPLGLAASTAGGVPSNIAEGFNVEGLEFAAGSTETAYLAFRAPQEPTNDRAKALLIPVTNFSSLVTDGNPGGATATFGAPLEWNLSGRGIREIRKNANSEYLVIAGTPDDSNSSFGLYTWDGNPADQPVLTNTPVSAVAEGAWESIVSVPDPLVSGTTVELLEDNGDTVWYADGLDSKDGLPSGLQKDLGLLFTLELPTPAAPSAPHVSGGANPNANGQFALSWEPSEATGAPTYTLQHQNAAAGWSDVASGLTSPEYVFTAGNTEGEGTWTYRVLESDEGGQSEPSPASEEVKVDETSPNTPTGTADRAPDYAGGGGWYRDSVEVSFASSGDPALADGSPGSGVNPASISSPQTFDASGSHTACGTDTDYAGNTSAQGCATVQVDATPPSLEVACPATVAVGSDAAATVTASDEQSGLASDPSATVPIDTSKAGAQTITRTAVDNVGHETTKSCTTEVQYTQVIGATISGPLTVKAGQAVELTSTAKVNGGVTVETGGALDVEGASIVGQLNSSGATLVRICGATIGGVAKLNKSSGPVVLGDGTGECAANTFGNGVVLKANTGNIEIAGSASLENSFHGSLSLEENSGTVSVVASKVHGALVVKWNADGATVAGNDIEETLAVRGNGGAPVSVSANTIHGSLTVAGNKAGATVAENEAGSLIVEENNGDVSIAGNDIHGSAVVKGNNNGVTVAENEVEESLTVRGNRGALTKVAGNTVRVSLTVAGNKVGVSVTANKVGGSLTVEENSGGTIVTDNEVHESLTVKGNGLPITDQPNTVEGKSKLQ